jgi:hypothetical protein
VFACYADLNMFEYRLTKYDPQKRGADGSYTADEWTSFSQVGEEVAGSVLTSEQYLRVENLYINAAVDMLAECCIKALEIRDLENHSRHRSALFELREGTRVSGDALHEALRSMLREEFWCRLEGEDGSYIHVGWDYYMYIGIACEVSACIGRARAAGLFVEPFVSPYRGQSGRSQTRG